MGTDLVSFKKNLGAMIERGELALPSTVDVNMFRNACIVAFQNNPEIRRCSPETVFTALRHLAGVGMMPDGKQAAIVRFGDKAQAMPMTRGYIDAVMRSGKVRSVKGDVIYEGETIEVWYDENGIQRFSHCNEDGSKLNPLKRGGKVLGALAVASMTDGTFDFEVFSEEQIEKRRKASPNQKGDKPTGIWASWYEEMCTKTVVRRLCARLPMSAEDLTILDRDPTLIAVEDPRDITPKETTEERLRRIKEEAATDTPEETPEPPQDALEGDTIDLPPYQENDVFPGEPAFNEGLKAFKAGKGSNDNPHKENPDYSNWLGGWLQAKEFAEEGVA